MYTTTECQCMFPTHSSMGSYTPTCKHFLPDLQDIYVTHSCLSLTRTVDDAGEK